MKKIETALKNLLLRILLVLSHKKNTKSDEKFSSNSKLLFIRLNRIGDALVTTPLLKYVKENLGSQIYILADRKNYFAFNNNSSVDKLVKLEKGIKGLITTLKWIKEENFDAIIDLHDDVSTTVTYLLAMSGVRNIFGLEKDNAVVYTKTVAKPDPSKTHVIERVMALSYLLGLPVDAQNANVCFYPQSSCFDKAEKYLKKVFPSSRFLIGINISAGSDARYWGTENFQWLMKLLNCYDVNVLLMCMPNDKNLAVDIAEGNEERLFYTPSFEEFAAMISRLDMLITPDTSVVHLASAFNVPVFGLYVKYNTTNMIWYPYKSDFESVVTTEPLLSGITKEEAVEKLQPFIEKFCSRKQEA